MSSRNSRQQRGRESQGVSRAAVVMSAAVTVAALLASHLAGQLFVGNAVLCSPKEVD